MVIGGGGTVVEVGGWVGIGEERKWGQWGAWVGIGIGKERGWGMGWRRVRGAVRFTIEYYNIVVTTTSLFFRELAHQNIPQQLHRTVKNI